jgi:SAM-dependent methyltransferase
MKTEIDSPLKIKSKAQLLRTVNVDDLTYQYQKKFEIDISHYFENINEIGIYKCNSTNYQFYFPFNIDGDKEFYQKLQVFDWYYMSWKWEHEKVKSLLKGNELILEVGSGDFGFVSKLNKEGFNIRGLELNDDSVFKATQQNLQAFDESIQQHAKLNRDTYDVVCSFQVLEHIWEVRSFIEAQIDCLKTSGQLIFAVPNNDSFIKLSDGGLLNKPPHHMGLWSAKALKGLTECFNLKLEKIYYEPLQDYHVNWYINSIIKFKIKPNKNLYKLFNTLKLKRLLKLYVRLNQNNIKGHTMLVIYKKK